jgi:hypothetical protein
MTMLLLLQTTNRQQEHTPAAEVGMQMHVRQQQPMPAQQAGK